MADMNGATVGILLVGGRSVRFGSPKAFAVHHDGSYFYERGYAALAAVCEHITIVTREELLHRFPSNLHVVTDIASYQGDGPLAGIYTAMVMHRAERYVVLPCDMPYVNAQVLRTFVTHAAMREDALVCAIQCGEEKYPLVSCWSKEMLEPLDQALKRGQRGVMKLLGQVGAAWLEAAKLTDHPEYVFRNINRPTTR